MTRGIDVQLMSLVARGENLSPYGSGMILQFHSPRLYIEGEATPVFNKGTPAMVHLEFMALEDRTAAKHLRFGRWRMETA